MRQYVLISFLFINTFLSGADKNYPVSDIPENLKSGMHAVIREKIVKITITDINKYTYYSKLVVTILDSKGNDYANESVDYDKLTKINFFKGAAYDAGGNLIKRLKQSDIYDRSYVSSASLFEDTRLKLAYLEQTSYPYTVEFEYEKQNNFLYDFNDFMLYVDDEASTQKAAYILAYNEQYPPRYKTFKIGEPIKSKNEDGLSQLVWSFESVIPEKFEPLSNTRDQIPFIISGPSHFEYSGYRGDMSSWTSYAKWITDLLKGRDEIPQATAEKIQSITAPLKTKEEKVRAVYEYMQNKTRYVNISLGIGGLQPFSARTVDEVGYSDCKGLSNYTIALLKTIGIDGLYATIMAGNRQWNRYTVDDFSSHQANHVIVAVPNGADTIWLECTSQTQSAGFMGSFTDNRKALINTPSGGKLVKTPSYPWQQNQQNRYATVTLNSAGHAMAEVKTTYSGLQSENHDISSMLHLGADKQKEWLQKIIDIPNFDLTGFCFQEKKGRIPSVTLTTSLSLRSLATANGKRMFLAPNLLNKHTTVPPKPETPRKNNVVISPGFVDHDTIEFAIPEALYAEFVPEPIKIKSRFGEYEATFSLSAGKLIYRRRHQMSGGTYPPESYQELIDFYKNINKADNTKVVFVNKT